VAAAPGNHSILWCEERSGPGPDRTVQWTVRSDERPERKRRGKRRARDAGEGGSGGDSLAIAPVLTRR
jgi:hypothetical protein